MRRIRVIREKLGRLKAWGIVHSDENFIRIDCRAKGKKEMEVIIHESLHVLFPDLEEDGIEKKAIILTNTLWYEHYRRVDNDTKIPLQDGKV